jgi:hypothetical protein
MSITTFNASVELNQSVEKQLGASIVCFTTRTVEFLASEYGFDAQEAIQRLGLDSVTVSRPMKKKAAAKAPKVPKVKRMVPSFPLPFCGAVKDDWCCGLRLNHGLYSQCTMAKDKEGEFCKTCVKQADKNENNKPTYGVIQDRMAVGAMEFRDSKGKQVVSYGNVMKKLKIDKETAIAEAAKFGFVIAEEQFEERKTTRGRPKKDASASDSDSDKSEKSEKKRGRPKKIKKVVAAADGDDLIASMVAQAQLEEGLEVLSSDGSESDASDKSEVSTSSTSSTKVKKTKAPKPVLTDEEKAAKKAATSAKRAATIAAKPELTDEEKEAKKAATSAKRAATLAAKKAKAEAEAPAAILGVTVPDDAITVTVVDTVSDIVEAVAGPPLEPAISVTELVAEAESDSDSEPEMEVKAFDWQGVSYLKADDNLLYNPESHEEVGIWNETLMKVDALPANCDEE